MTEAFIGLTVELKLHDGFIVQGIVSMVNPTTQQLQLEHGKFTCYPVIYIVSIFTSSLFIQ
jgi:hypothetical protein